MTESYKRHLEKVQSEYGELAALIEEMRYRRNELISISMALGDLIKRVESAAYIERRYITTDGTMIIIKKGDTVEGVDIH